MTTHKPKILVLFYSMYGHTYTMAQSVVKGVQIAGGEPILEQVQELIPTDKWDDNTKSAKELMNNVSIADPKTSLKGIDGLVVGTPTRFGNMTAQMRNFWDQTSDDWMAGTLIGKPAATFTSSATQHGGQESTLLTTQITLLHHGAIIVGFPYSFKDQMTLEEITGSSPYGVSTIAGGMGERTPSELELKMASDLGSHLTKIALKLSNTGSK